mmetsp:Transcript_14128/g.21326  ORF Transcript_14128/g.21326 Transcript_14128/m.21326 type:complete len:425 (-) Transcript_14128:346-1620(-)
MLLKAQPRLTHKLVADVSQRALIASQRALQPQANADFRRMRPVRATNLMHKLEHFLGAHLHLMLLFLLLLTLFLNARNQAQTIKHQRRKRIQQALLAAFAKMLPRQMQTFVMHIRRRRIRHQMNEFGDQCLLRIKLLLLLVVTRCISLRLIINQRMNHGQQLLNLVGRPQAHLGVDECRHHIARDTRNILARGQRAHQRAVRRELQHAHIHGANGCHQHAMQMRHARRIHRRLLLLLHHRQCLLQHLPDVFVLASVALRCEVHQLHIERQSIGKCHFFVLFHNLPAIRLENGENVLFRKLERVFTLRRVLGQALHQLDHDAVDVHRRLQLAHHAQKRLQRAQMVVVAEHHDEALHQVLLRDAVLALDDLLRHLLEHIVLVNGARHHVQLRQAAQVRADQHAQLQAFAFALAAVTHCALMLHTHP